MVFLSDGITESEKMEVELLGYESTMAIVNDACKTGSNAEAIIDRILLDASGFAGEASQVDDMTCVVLRVE